MKNQKGFSLIELMIVVVIIGLLATVGVPQYQKFIAKTKQAEAKSMLSGIYTGEKAFFAEWNSYLGDFRAIGFQPDGLLLYNVGFLNGGNGPNNHPNNAFRGAPPANARTARALCGATVAAAEAFPGYDCGVTTANNVPGGSTVAGAVSAGVVGSRFDAGAIANLDGDAALDQWRLDEAKTFRQLSDDVYQ